MLGCLLDILLLWHLYTSKSLKTQSMTKLLHQTVQNKYSSTSLLEHQFPGLANSFATQNFQLCPCLPTLFLILFFSKLPVLLSSLPHPLQDVNSDFGPWEWLSSTALFSYLPNLMVCFPSNPLVPIPTAIPQTLSLPKASASKTRFVTAPRRALSTCAHYTETRLPL